MTTHSFLIFLGLALAACGSDARDPLADTGPTGTDVGMTADATTTDVPLVPAPTPEQACEGQDARSLRCGTEPQDRAECIADFACASFNRADSIGPFVQCNNERACDAGDDRCFIISELGLVESAESMTYTADCNARRAECADGFSDDWCYASLANVDSLASMSPCLSMGCDAIVDCIDAVYDAACEG